MTDKICLITGATSGLGESVAHALARQGATVVLACRDEARGAAVQADIQMITSYTTVDVLPLDLAALDSVRAAAAEFRRRYDRLDVLINNAAVFKNRRVMTAEGLEMMFATNHLGHFLLTNLLLDRLRAASAARVLTVTAPSTVPLNFDDLQWEKQFSALRAFGASKMCNMLFTFELARRMRDTAVTANAFHPGLMRSRLMQEAPGPLRWVTGLFSQAPEQAAAALAHLALAPEVASSTGRFFKGRQPIDSPPYARNPAPQQRLWDVSCALASLSA
jgi:NAD(P)-dependent dehydrogenase (short-subunit alcohol dehydrogenase family)